MMQVGDIFRLKTAFHPAEGDKAYEFCRVAALVPSKLNQEPSFEVLVHLYDPSTRDLYIDNRGAQALYSFYPEELDTPME